MRKNMEEPPQPPKSPTPGLKVIHASMMRMGTMSMSHAYRRLGFATHHGLDDVVHGNPWQMHERAAKATFPCPTVPREWGPETDPRFTRREWDEIWGNEFDVATDMACPYTFELLRAYPEAKVVVVQRPFEKWWPSYYKVVVESLPTRPRWLAPVRDWLVWRLFGIRAFQASRCLQLGFFQVPNVEDITEELGRKKYDEFYAEVRRLVPEERRLEYELGEGWDRLADFLGRDVPEGIEFPRANELSKILQQQTDHQWKYYGGAALKIGLGVAAVAAIPHAISYVF